MNPIMSFFSHLVHLFQKDAPKIEAVLQPEIDLMESLIKKFATADLSTAVTVILSGLTSGTPVGSVIASGAVALKAAVVAQGIEASDEELNLVAQALTKNQAAAINGSISAAQAAQAPQPPAAPTPAPAV